MTTVWEYPEIACDPVLIISYWHQPFGNDGDKYMRSIDLGHLLCPVLLSVLVQGMLCTHLYCLSSIVLVFFLWILHCMSFRQLVFSTFPNHRSLYWTTLCNKTDITYVAELFGYLLFVIIPYFLYSLNPCSFPQPTDFCYEYSFLALLSNNWNCPAFWSVELGCVIII